MDKKEELLSFLEIAEINFLMALKELRPELVDQKAVETVNPVAWIVGHCVLNFDRLLSFYTNEPLITKEQTEYYIYGSKRPELKDYKVPFVELIDIHLEVTGKVFELLRELKVEQFDELPKGQAKGTLADRIKSIALHVTGHTGQIVQIRRMLDNHFWSLIGGVLKEDREKLRKEWLVWWGENKASYIS